MKDIKKHAKFLNLSTNKMQRMVSVKMLFILLPIIIVLGIFVASYNGMLTIPTFLQQRVDLLPDINAKHGTPNLESETEIDNSEFRIVINQTPTIKFGEKKCNIEINNPSSNYYSAVVTLKAKDDGEILAKMHRIDPGKNIEETKLSKILEVGEHSVDAMFDLYDDEKRSVGVVSASITIRVLE